MNLGLGLPLPVPGTHAVRGVGALTIVVAMPRRVGFKFVEKIWEEVGKF